MLQAALALSILRSLRDVLHKIHNTSFRSSSLPTDASAFSSSFLISSTRIIFFLFVMFPKLRHPKHETSSVFGSSSSSLSLFYEDFRTEIMVTQIFLCSPENRPSKKTQKICSWIENLRTTKIWSRRNQNRTSRICREISISVVVSAYIWRFKGTLQTSQRDVFDK